MMDPVYVIVGSLDDGMNTPDVLYGPYYSEEDAIRLEALMANKAECEGWPVYYKVVELKLPPKERYT